MTAPYPKDRNFRASEHAATLFLYRGVFSRRTRLDIGLHGCMHASSWGDFLGWRHSNLDIYSAFLAISEPAPRAGLTCVMTAALEKDNLHGTELTSQYPSNATYKNNKQNQPLCTVQQADGKRSFPLENRLVLRSDLGMDSERRLDLRSGAASFPMARWELGFLFLLWYTDYRRDKKPISLLGGGHVHIDTVGTN